MQELLNMLFTNFTVRDSGINYQQKIGSMFSSGNIARMSLVQAQVLPYTDARKSVRITRLIIERKPGKLMPDLRFMISKFSEFKHEADTETREYLGLNSNNYGNLLLELPESPRNIAAVGKFLGWLDIQINDILKKKETDNASNDSLLPVYLRKEPTQDSVLLDFVKRGLNKLTEAHQDVVVYRDAACKEVFCRWPWYFNSKPTKRHKVIMLNCYKWRVIWIE